MSPARKSRPAYSDRPSARPPSSSRTIRIIAVAAGLIVVVAIVYAAVNGVLFTTNGR